MTRTLEDLDALDRMQLRALTDDDIAAFDAKLLGGKLATFNRNQLYVVFKALPSKRGMKEKMSVGIRTLCLLLEIEEAPKVVEFARGVALVLANDGLLYPYDLDKKDAKIVRKAGAGRIARSWLSAILLAGPAGAYLTGLGAQLSAQSISWVANVPSADGDGQQAANTYSAMHPRTMIARDTLQNVHDLIIYKLGELLLAVESLGVLGEASRIVKEARMDIVDHVANAVAELANKYPELREKSILEQPHLRDRHNGGTQNLAR